MVHLEALRTDIGGLDRSEVVDLWPHLRVGWFYLLPIGLLLFYLLVERLTVARSAWFTLVAIMALVAFVAAYGPRTRVPLVGAIVALTAAQVVAYLLAGVGVLAAATGGGGEAMAPVEAVFAAAGDLGTIVVVVSLAFLLVRPRIDAPLLDLDAAVDEAGERVARSVGRPALARLNAFRYSVFLGVVALGVTVIGFFYRSVGAGERALYAVAALLLMAPMLLLNAVTDVLGVVGVLTNLGQPLVLDVGMRALGGALFAFLALRNRRGADEKPNPTAATTSD